MLNLMRHIARCRCSIKNTRPFGAITRNIAGNVLPMMAAGIFVLAGLIGGGVDMARAYKAERRLQAACDAGALAGRRAVSTNGFDDDPAVAQEATAYFTANFTDAEQETHGTTFIPSSPDDGGTIVGTAQTSLNTLIMKIFGFTDFDLQVTCSASMGVGNSDIMFVLDSTDSMDKEPDGTNPEPGEETKLQSLQGSMKDFYDTVHTATEGSNARIRYGFVPYSTTVNVGALLMGEDGDPSWVADEMEVSSVQFVNWNETPINSWTQPGYTYSSPSYGSWSHDSNTKYGNKTCGNWTQTDTAWVDNGSTSTTVSYAVDPTTGHQIKTTGLHQPQTMTDYECRKSNGDWYRDKRTGTRDKRSDSYQERTSTVVTADNAAFANAIRQTRTIDTSIYKTFAVAKNPIGVRTNGTKTRFDGNSTVWPGCIQERKTVRSASFSFVSLATGIDPAEALDLDIDMEPTGNNETKWKPLWPQVVRDRDDISKSFEAIVSTDGTSDITGELGDNIPPSYCIKAAQLLTEMDEAAFDAYANGLQTSGYTYHDIGILWGARLASPTGIFADNVNEEADNGGTVSRHLIFMTDGQLDTETERTTAYGLERLDRRVTDLDLTNDGDIEDQQMARHRLRFLALCEAVKARGIRLWAIAFGTTLSADLVTCATDGLASAFQANNADELDEHFQEIANQVGELRVTQ